MNESDAKLLVETYKAIQEAEMDPKTRHDYEEHLLHRQFGDIVKMFNTDKGFSSGLTFLFDSSTDGLVAFANLVEDNINMRIILEEVQRQFPKAKIGFLQMPHGYLIGDVDDLIPMIVDYSTGYFDLQITIPKAEDIPRNKLVTMLKEYLTKSNLVREAIYKRIPE